MLRAALNNWRADRDARRAKKSKKRERPGHVEIVRNKKSQWFVRVVASNGRKLVWSETYESRANAENCLSAVHDALDRGGVKYIDD